MREFGKFRLLLTDTVSCKELNDMILDENDFAGFPVDPDFNEEGEGFLDRIIKSTEGVLLLSFGLLAVIQTSMNVALIFLVVRKRQKQEVKVGKDVKKDVEKDVEVEKDAEKDAVEKK